MKIVSFLLLSCLAGVSLSSGKENWIKELDLKSLGFELPLAITLRAEMVALQRSEFLEGVQEVGLAELAGKDYRENPASWASVFRTFDGLIFLQDNLHMALWVRKDNEWKCLLMGVRVDKTFGGQPPSLPVSYMGQGFFAVTETVPGKVSERSAKGLPQARAVTFLIDSESGKVRERGESFVYEHNPPVKVPKAWVERYQLKGE
jgi:hypothetical protein